MFRIGEFSKLMQVSIRMLRYYDEEGLLKPARTDYYTGYRYYSTDQIVTLQKILFLKDTGFTVSEITEALHNWNGTFISAKMENKKEEIRKTIEAETWKLKRIETVMETITDDTVSVRHDFIIKKIPAYQVLSLRKIIPDYFSEELLWKELGESVKKEKIRLPQNTENFAIYHDEEYKEQNVDVEICVRVDRREADRPGIVWRTTEAVESMASTLVYGPFENIAGVYLSFAHWLSAHTNFSMEGKNRQICHRGPWNETSPEKYITEIQIPVKKYCNFLTLT
ncbi:MerR family transcriptional regulator [Brucepastera parasyntrophica]|uniref:MerR family transcriptional regulator n=1 Tax=Brucepastera parasyntrophica TaxID=2880008 RepID=UPI00210AC6E6|nr:MerR family transcriptional regulator [Brucepastera parasyntrophica]ULQ59521.1 MerR family transcriptional regulator [Brucepastera parasyntrophica]